tara:strand:+ start:44027 stop:44734 length:708 start_codon:yes stop_codon:yes gene_type:complete
MEDKSFHPYPPRPRKARPLEIIAVWLALGAIGWIATIVCIKFFIAAVTEPAPNGELTMVDMALVVPADEVFYPVLGIARESSLSDAANPEDPVRAMARIVRPPTSCIVDGGLPIAILEGRPIIGNQGFRIGWTTRPTSPPAHPAFATVLLVSNRKTEPALIGGAPGCWLQVHADHILVPGAAGILTQYGGEVELRWTPPANLMGIPFYLQLLVADPRNELKVTVAPMVEIVVGIR